MMRRLILLPALATVVGLAVSCQQAAPRVFVALAGEPVVVSPEPLVLSSAEGLRADNDIVGIWLGLPKSYRLADDWSISTPEARNVRFRATARLSDGSVVSLDRLAYSGELCLETAGPLSASAVAVTITCTHHVVVSSVTWVSTTK